MRIIGLDIHRVFAEAVAWEDGNLRRIGRAADTKELSMVSARLSHLGAE